MAKRHKFHCAKCNSECAIYKRGKGHRVFVCSRCGILATNPINLAGGLEGAATGAALGSVVPGVGTAVGGVAGGLIGAFAGGGKKKADDSSEPQAYRAPVDRYTVQERVHDALGGRRWEQ